MENPRKVLPEHMRGIQLVNHYSMALTLPGGTPYVSALQVVVFQSMDEDRLAAQLAAAGYPGFSYMSGEANCKLAELLLSALVRDELDSRIAESLPWLVLTYHDMDWDWVTREAKIHDVTNRLGFTVTLARELAQQQRKLNNVQSLRRLKRSCSVRSLLGKKPSAMKI